jgi:hypothetical protein
VADHVAVLRPFAAEITLHCHVGSIPADKRFCQTRHYIVAESPAPRLRCGVREGFVLPSDRAANTMPGGERGSGSRRLLCRSLAVPIPPLFSASIHSRRIT